MISGINSSLAALFTFGKMLSNTAGNVANVNTDGYKKTVGTIEEDGEGLPELDLSKSDSPGALVQEDGVTTETSNVDLLEELPQMMVAQRGYEANIKALSVQDDVLKSTLDILA
jgi:flagellar basal-body rod protein FlgC